MFNSMISRMAALALSLVFSSTTWAAAPPKPDTADPDRDAVIAKLTTKQVSTLGLTQTSKGGFPGLWLGTGLNGAETDNANDETLGLAAQLPEVEALTIWKGRFTNEGFAKLAALPKLRSLDVYGSQIDPQAFVVLSKLKSLEALRFMEYPVSDELLGFLGESPNLNRLHIQNRAYGVTPAGFAKFLASAKNLDDLMLNGDFVDDACLKVIGQKKGMKVLLTDSKRITPKAWLDLAGLTKLERLDIPGTSIDDEGMKALEGMKDLTYLTLNDTRITDTGMESLAGLTKLHDLGLDVTKITDKGMANLQGMTEMANLYVGMTDVTAKGLAFVPRKEQMSMMRTGKAALTPKQLDEVMGMYPQTQIFDPAGYWTTERTQAAMKELGKDLSLPKK